MPAWTESFWGVFEVRTFRAEDPFVSGAMFVLGILTAGFSLFSTRKLKNILRTRFKL